MREYTPYIIQDLPKNGIFVFGSNTEGRHGKGAALVARQKFGANYGKARGLQGRSFAIVTKDLRLGLRSVSIKEIFYQLATLMYYARRHPELKFYVTKLGSSLAGYTEEEMKSAFKVLYIPDNVILPKEYEVRDE